MEKRSFRYGLAELAAAGVFLVGCGGGDKESIFPTQAPIIPSASATLEISPTSTASTEVVMPSSTPEVEQVVDCRIVPEKFCKEASVINVEFQGKKYTFIGLNVPPGTPIYAPITGELAKIKESGEPFSGFSALVSDEDKTIGFNIRGDIKFENMIYEGVEEGQQIATVGDDGIKNLGEYNLVFTVNRTTPNGPETDENWLEENLPDAFQKPAVSVVISVVGDNYRYATDTPTPISR